MNRFTIALLGMASAALLSTTGASAAVVCNDDGDCWHTKQRYEYKPDFRLRVYGDNWRWHKRDHDRYRWREHDGRGYWRKGVWIEF